MERLELGAFVRMRGWSRAPLSAFANARDSRESGHPGVLADSPLPFPDLEPAQSLLMRSLKSSQAFSVHHSRSSPSQVVA